MSSHCYSEINLHLTWHTKDNMPLLRHDLERQVHAYLREHSITAPGVFFHDLGGTDDHVHVVIRITPSVLISDFVRQLKGGSAHHINNVLNNRRLLEWQGGYGVVAFGARDLPWVLDYVRHQREHHAAGRVQSRLESVGPDAGPARESELA